MKEKSLHPAGQINSQSILVDILQEKPQATHGEEEEGPVDHPLIVLEGGGAGYQGVPGTVDGFVWLRLPDLGILRDDVLRSGG